MKRKLKPKDPFEIIVSKVSERVENEINELLVSLKFQIEDIFDLQKRNPPIRKSFIRSTFVLAKHEQEAEFNKAKDITKRGKVRRRT